MARIDWGQSADVVARIVRAYDPRPGALAQSPAGQVKLFGAYVSDARSEALPGTVLGVDGDGMTVACNSGAVRIASVHPAGKRRISPQEWARGRGIAQGERLF
jgi:methionyl-tRNA formyltransferase